MRPFPALAIGCLVIGALFLVVGWGDRSNVLWTGRAVHAQERDGIVSYTVDGRPYTIDDPGSHRTGSTTVYLNPRTPAQGVLNSPVDRMIDVLTIGVPVAAAPILMAAGIVRQRRRRKRAARASEEPGESFGHGLDPAVVRQILDERHGRT